MFNVLLEHFVVSPEILCLKQRMFFVLFFFLGVWGGGCFLFEKICNVIVDCRSFDRNGTSSLLLNLEKREDSWKRQKIVCFDGEKWFVGRFLQIHPESRC